MALPALLTVGEENPPVTSGFPSQSASNAGFAIFCDVSTVEQTLELAVIWDAMMPTVMSL